jgi:hypothetical protein
MAKNIAPTKATAGGGFAFEDEVVAYFLCCLLNNRPPLDPVYGTISRIDFQTRVDGWFLDDILLTLTSEGETRHCALSVKSNQQFTRNAAPGEFVSVAWEQFLHEKTERFDKDRDLLGLVTAPLHQEVAPKLYDLLKKARSQDPRNLPIRLMEQGYVSDLERKLFFSFECSDALARKHGITRENIGELLRCIVILELDFEHELSKQLQESVQICRDILTSGSLEEANSLWKTLLLISNEYRNSGGYLDLCRLASKLRSLFQLQDSPDQRADWQSLRRRTENALEAIPSKIGNKVFLPRINELKKIETGFCKSKAIVIVGPSGCGKTVTAKSWAEKALGSCKAIWWNARDFEVENFTTFENKLQLAHSLEKILAAVLSPHAYVIIDGLDRLFSEAALQNLSTFIHMLQLNIVESPWRVLFTCQLEEWNRIQRQLAHFDIRPSDWQVVIAEEFAIDDLNSVWETFPTLRPISLQPQLKSLLLKPKILDLLATNISIIETADTTRWVGESHLIEWFWETEVCKPPNAVPRTRFFMKLGEIQGDRLESETPIDESSLSDLSYADDLIRDRLCKMHEGRLSFYHDLFGDWARQRILMGRAETLRECLKCRIASPLWHRAVRLYGLHLLERNSEIAQWRSALNSLSSSKEEFGLAQDLLLESVIFAANPLPILERMWLDLAANDGLFLRRLLGRFLHVATLPNPHILKIARESHSESETEAATVWRVPYWPYWLPMIRFLYKHLMDVAKLAPKQIAEIAEKWLQEGSESWPFRRETAELSLETAERVLRLEQRDSTQTIDKKTKEVAYRAAIATARELPERVATFALMASGRKGFPRQESENCDKTENVKKAKISTISGTYELSIPPPWPDGPSRHVDPVFQEVCLKTDALHPLIMSNPDIALEVLLALLIEEPRARFPFEHGLSNSMDLSIEDISGWFPPFYFHGPFLFFLENQPTKGLEVILRLVNFATERWADELREDCMTPPEVTINLSDGEHRWVGDYMVYYWYRDHSPCPCPVVAALMALEKWLYDNINEGKSIDGIIELILQHADSVAFAGLLSAVGRKNPSLFKDLLQPLLAVPEFHYWESKYHSESHDYLMIGWFGRGRHSVKLAQRWYSLPHRKKGLHDWAQDIFLNIQQMRPFFGNACLSWQNRLEVLHEGDELRDYLEQLVAHYNIKNFRVQEHPEFGDIWIFQPPWGLRRKNEKIIKESEKRMLLLFFPLQCRQILNKSQPLAHDNLLQFWTVLQRISEFTPREDVESEINNVEDAICGGIAVLVELHRDWLKQNPEKEKWCIDALLKTIQNPPEPRGFDSEVDIADWRWDSFCAQSIPLLWVENPDSPVLRECVAILATSHHYKTVEILFASTVRVRGHLGENFKQLQHFLLRWAATRRKQYLISYGIFHSFDMRRWLKQEIEAFVKKSIPSQLPSWEKVSVKEPYRKHNFPNFLRRRPRQSPGLDLQLIEAAFTWLPSLDHAIDETERIEWINFWKEALDCTLRMLGEETEDDYEIEGTPYEWDRWVFARLALLIVELRTDEHPEDFWRPILNLGVAGHCWVNDFLEQWFLRGLSSKHHENFVREWRAMAGFAFHSSKWNYDLVKHGHHLREMWCYLMSFDTITLDMWNCSKKPIVRQMRDMYELWAKAHLDKFGCAKPFIVFLKQPAAEEILLDSLIWLEKAANQTDDLFLRGYRIQEELASLLDVCWSSHQSKLRHSEATFDAFKDLLKRLADHQNKLAMELQDRVSKS